MGIQLITNNDVFSSSDYLNPDEVGIYVSGGDTFKQANIRPLTGFASYNGPIGAAVYPNNRTFNDDDTTTIYGYVNLRADFDNSGELGQINGSISNFMTRAIYDPGDPIAPRRVPGSLTLQQANIGNSHSGFFEGGV